MMLMFILHKCLYGWTSVHCYFQIRLAVPLQRVDTEAANLDQNGQLVLHDRDTICVCRERL